MAVLPCINALGADFVNRWGNGNNILDYTEGSRMKPRSFKPEQVIATTLDPHTKRMHGVQKREHANVWKHVED